ncbi:MAG: ankyrin repeat domain-containing protein [Pseudomonadota bacterium]
MKAALLAVAVLLLAQPTFGVGTPASATVEGIPSLVQAAQADDLQAALKLLKGRGAARVKAQDGTTALHWAAHNDNEKLVERLLKAGADPSARNDYGATPLSEAAVVGNVAVISRLLEAGANVDSPNPDGQTALMIVARSSNTAAAEVLLRHGAKVDAREQWREQTALMWAAAQAQPAMVRLLLAHGAAVDARSHVNDWQRQITAEPRAQARPAGGNTALLFAARRGCLECAKALVEAGADVNLTDPEGISPLLMATANLNFDTASYLLAKGANPNKWDRAGRAPLYAAVDLNTIPDGGRADRPSLDKTTSLELIGQLLDAGANPNLQLKLMPPYRSLRDDRGADGMLAIGATALLRAAKAGDVASMKLLLQHGANVELPNVNGITPLMAAAGNASSKIDTRGRYKTSAQAIAAIDVLIAAGADVNGRDALGQTAVFGAAVWGWNDVLTSLIKHGARLDIVDARGKTVVDAAMGVAGGSGRTGSDPQPATAAMLRQLLASTAK